MPTKSAHTDKISVLYTEIQHLASNQPFLSSYVMENEPPESLFLASKPKFSTMYDTPVSLDLTEMGIHFPMVSCPRGVKGEAGQIHVSFLRTSPFYSCTVILAECAALIATFLSFCSLILESPELNFRMASTDRPLYQCALTSMSFDFRENVSQ